ncbi:MAG: hypothetical protein CMF96_09085 [Candidatus Marinimicrobia bacterium]|nr:hypothetical protein [Candidatus Neomarinimicrobiota bacterium]
MNKYIIGIDGGASNTLGVILDSHGNTLGVSSQVGTNLAINPEGVPTVIVALIKELCLNSKISLDDISAIGLGLAGASSDEGREMLFKYLDKERLTKKTIISSDAEAAFKILCPTNCGIMLSIGTGIICYGKDIQGRVYRTAGHGHGVDKGSGYWIGEQLLWQLSLNESAEISDYESMELSKILSKKVKDISVDHGIKSIINSEDKVKKIASLAEDVCFLAENENDLALGIILEATREAAEYLIQLKELMNLDDNEVILYGNGGLLGNQFFRRNIIKALQFDFKSITWALSQLSPAYGASLIAAELHEIPLSLHDIVLKTKKNG